jgi:tRNA (cmo5U34)-methyltransferase
VSQFHFDPDTYPELIHEAIPAYDELQERIAAATEGGHVSRILDLGAGTGATARGVLARHPGARLVALDVSDQMLARIALPGVERVVRSLEEPLPDGPFDLVVSALAVHHLDAAAKRDLFARVPAALRPGGRFVLGDVVVADEVVAPLTEGYDLPDRAEDQLEWLRAAGFDARLEWAVQDLALLVGDA